MSRERSRQPESPPRLARWIVGKICSEERRPWVAADLEELFQRCLDSQGSRRARRRYWRELLILVWMLPMGRGLHGRRTETAGRLTSRALRNSPEMIVNSFRELGFALRRWRRRPALFVAAVSVLSIGIAAETVIFSLISGVLLRPLPYPHSERLYEFVRTNPRKGGSRPFSIGPGPALDLKNKLESFQCISVYRWTSLFLNTPDRLVQLSGIRADEDFLPLFGFTPLLGRGLTQENERGVLISFRVWRDYYESDPDVLGHRILLSGVGYSIVGVLPPGFEIPNARPDLVLPHDDELDPAERRYGAFYIFGRLPRDIDREQAQAEVDALAAALEEAYPETDQDWKYQLVAVFDRIVSQADRRILFTLQGLAGLLLLVCCINVAVLLLSKAGEDRREVALRLALGSEWRHIMGRFLCESALVALAGVAAGALSAWWLLQSLPYFLPLSLPRLHEAVFDWRVAAACGLVGLAVTVVCGAIPAFSMLRSSPMDSIRDSRMSFTTSAAARYGKALVAVELALAVLLASGAGLMMRTLQELGNLDLRFNPDRLIAVNFSLPSFKYGRGESRIDPSDAYQGLLEAASSVPGVRQAAILSDAPLKSSGIFTSWSRPQAGLSGDRVRLSIASSEVFRVLGVNVLQGRTLRSSDGSPDRAYKAVVVSKDFARQAFPDGEALGADITLHKDGYRIVGIVDDFHNAGLRDDPTPVAYVHYRQKPQNWGVLLVKTEVHPQSLMGLLEQSLREANRDVDLRKMASMEELLVEALGPRTRAVALTSGFTALMALILVAVGTFGVVFGSVRRRTREIGIRLTLGASRRLIVLTVVRRSLALTAGGLVLGLALAVALSHSLQGYLYGISSSDPLALAGAVLVPLLVTLAAHLPPLRHALKVDPVRTLRYEK
ncbi:MAG TPA: ADOP family duplicated permease [Acidobacteriota bacterium]|nr:ADOP family duplicated permease [Acidobacteriota bacterium]